MIQEPVNAYIELDLPERWEAFQKDECLALEAQGSYIYLNAIQVPSHIPSGLYSLALRLKKEQKENDEVSADQLICQVIQLNRLIFKIEDPPPVLAEGDIFHIRLHYINDGNIPISLQVEIEDSFGEKEPEFYFLSLNPNEKKEQVISLCAKTKAKSQKIEHSCLFIKIKNVETSELLESRAFIFDILPLGVRASDPYLRLPGLLSLNTARIDGQKNIFCEIRGEGTFDLEKEISTQFFLRAPFCCHDSSTETLTSFYWGLDYPNWSLELGDTNYSLAPLAEGHWYARGGKFAFGQEDWSTGFFYAQDILNLDYRRKESGIYFDANIDDRLGVRSSYLYKQNKKEIASHIGEIDVNFQLSSRLWLETSIAHNFNHFPNKKAT